MKYEEIEKIEERSDNNLGVIHLVKEGDWWRAYEWSAYLCNHIPCELEEGERLKPSKKRSSLFEDGIIFVGLKAISFKKYLPCLGSTVEDVDLESGIIDIDVSQYFCDVDFSGYKDILSKWKGNFKFKQSEKRNEAKSAYSGNSIRDVLYDIASFPIENRTPLECMVFLSEIKEAVTVCLKK